MSEANPAGPRGDTFTYAGATVEVTDAATILAAARVSPVVLLRGAMWPAAVQWVEVRVSSAEGRDGPVHLFTGEIGTADKERIRSLILVVSRSGGRRSNLRGTGTI